MNRRKSRPEKTPPKSLTSKSPSGAPLTRVNVDRHLSYTTADVRPTSATDNNTNFNTTVHQNTTRQHTTSSSSSSRSQKNKNSNVAEPLQSMSIDHHHLSLSQSSSARIPRDQRRRTNEPRDSASLNRMSNKWKNETSLVTSLDSDDFILDFQALPVIKGLPHGNFKLFPNKVNKMWYKRYADLLPGITTRPFQPYREVEARDIELAARQFYGEDYECEMAVHSHLADAKKKDAYHRVQTKAKKQATDFAPEFGYSKKDSIILSKTALLLREKHKVSTFSEEVNLPPNSRWRFLRESHAMKRIHAMYKEGRRGAAHRNFIIAFLVVRSVNRFIKAIASIVGDTSTITLAAIQARRIQRRIKDRHCKNSDVLTHLDFDLAKYNFSENEEGIAKMPLEVLLTLTKPWHERTTEEIDQVLDVLQIIPSFIQLPKHIQRRLATIGWYMMVPRGKVIIRQDHLAMGFYFLLTGRVHVTCLVGDGTDGDQSYFEDAGYIYHHSVFGEEGLEHIQIRRGYTVTSMTYSELLDIQFQDYNDYMVSVPKEEVVPEHILFIRRLDFLSKFPPKKLLSEALENIYTYYFRPKTVVAKSLKNAEFVYIVKQGHCRVLKKNIVITKIELKDEIGPKRESSTSQTTTETWENLRDYMSSINSVEMDEALKQETPKANEPREQRTQAVFEEINQEYLRESKKIEMKALRMAKSLVRNAPNSHLTLIHNMLQNIQRLERQMGDSFEDVLEIHAFFREIAAERTTDSDSLSHSERKTGWLRKSIERGKKTWDKTQEKPKVEITLTLTDSSMEQAMTEVESASGGNVESVEEKNGKRKTKAGDELELLVRQEKSTGQASIEASGTSVQEHLDTSTSPTESVTDSKNFKTTTQWIVEKFLIKGDQIGNEWLDYRDGPFNPPADMTLVSDGAELVMIKRTVLLTYLRKTW